MRKSRREFIKTTIRLGAAGFLAGSFSCQTLKSIRFGIVTDSHYANREPAGSRFYNDSATKMQQAVDLFNAEKVDFVIELGDFKDQDSPPEEAGTIQHLQAIEKIYQKCSCPIYHVLGNHDMDSISKEQFLQNVKNSGIPSDKSYYTFEQNGFHIVVLDANFNSDGTPYDHGNYDWTDANISKEELGWLEKDLTQNSKPTIVFIHQLLDGDGSHYVNNAAHVRKILEDSVNVIAVFQGHKHDGQYNKINNIHYITCEAMVEELFPVNRFYIAQVGNNFDIKITSYAKAKKVELL